MVIIGLVLLLSGAQGSVPSQPDPIKAALDLIIDNKAEQAIALLEPLAVKNPDAADLREMLGSAHAAAAEALEADPGAARRRRMHLETAATHFRRTIELTHVNRASNLGSLVDIYSPNGLGHPMLEETYARRLVDDHPSLSSGYAPLARVLAAAGRLDAANEVLGRARTAVPAESQEQIGVQLLEQVTLLQQTDVPAARLLLNEAMRVADRLLAASPDDGRMAMFKSVVLENHANRVEQDPARRAQMLVESRRLWEQGRQANAARRASEPPLPPPAPAVPPAAERHYRSGVEAWDTVNSNPNMAAPEALKLLAQANAAFDAALKLHPKYVEALIFKALTLRLEATRYEKEPVRRQALLGEADRLRARGIELQKTK